MGFFSWTCAKTGLPIMAGVGNTKDEIRRAQSEVVLIFPDNTKYRGMYDSYGRVGSEEITDIMGNATPPKLVLAAFYDNERYADLKQSGDEPGQGFFHDAEFIDRMFWAAKEREIDTWQYLARNREYGRLLDSGSEAIDNAMLAPDRADRYAGCYRAHELLTRFRNAEDKEDLVHAVEGYNDKLRPSLREDLRAQPPLLVLAGLDSLFDRLRVVVSRTVMDAWRGGYAAPASLDWNAELLLDSGKSPSPKP
jgi:hypothetical protein